jgi:hypothetical protein
MLKSFIFLVENEKVLKKLRTKTQLRIKYWRFKNFFCFVFQPSSNRFDVNPMLKADSQNFDRFYDESRRSADPHQSLKSMPVNPFYEPNEETFGVQTRNDLEKPSNAGSRRQEPIQGSSNYNYRRGNVENPDARYSDDIQHRDSDNRRNELSQPRYPVSDRPKELQVQERYQEQREVFQPRIDPYSAQHSSNPHQQGLRNRAEDRFPNPVTGSDRPNPSPFHQTSNSTSSFINPFQTSDADNRQGQFSRPQSLHSTQGPKPGNFPKPAGSCMAKESWEDWS